MGHNFSFWGILISGGFNRKTAQAFRLTTQQILLHWNSLGIYCCGKALIWQDPRDLILTGSKLYMNHIVTEAALALGQSQPVIAVWDNLTVNLVQGILDGKINGEFSSNTIHVYSKHTKNAVTNFWKTMEDQRKFWCWDKQKICENPKWFIQLYIPSLIYLGEVPTFITNGIIINIITSTPDLDSSLLDVTQTLQLQPLCNIRYNYLPSISSTWDCLTK